MDKRNDKDFFLNDYLVDHVLVDIYKEGSYIVRNKLIDALRLSLSDYLYPPSKISNLYRLGFEVLISRKVILDRSSAVDFLNLIGYKITLASIQKITGTNLYRSIYKSNPSRYGKQLVFTYSEIFQLINENKGDKAFRFHSDPIDKLIDDFGTVIKKPSEDFYFNYEREKVKNLNLENDILKPCPYSIKRFKIHNYCGIKDCDSGNLPANTKWIVFTGNNGAGKTAILRALTLGLNGLHDFDGEPITNEQIRVGIELKNSYERNSNYILNLKGLDFVPFDFFAAYGTSRLGIQGAEDKNLDRKRSSKIYNIFNDDGQLLNIEYETLALYKDDEILYKDIIDNLVKLMPSIQDIRIERDGISYIEKEILSFEDKGGETFGKVTLNKLSAGNRMIIAMVGDIIIRLRRLMLSKGKKIKKVSDLEGIVIIDEFDVHLHPFWQINLPEKLSTIFPKIQFIISIHSPLVVMGIPPNAIFFTLNRSKKEGITIKSYDINHLKLLPEAALTSPIFDLDSLISRWTKDVNDIYYEKNFNEMKVNQIIKNKLKENLGISPDILKNLDEDAEN